MTPEPASEPPGPACAIAPGASAPVSNNELAAVLAATAAVLAHRKTIVLRAPDERRAIEIVLGALPAPLRCELSFAYGMRLSPQRDFQLLFYGGPVGPDGVDRLADGAGNWRLPDDRSPVDGRDVTRRPVANGAVHHLAVGALAQYDGALRA